MAKVLLSCSYCSKKFYREKGRVNEEVKFGWHPYCSLKCLGSYRTKKILFKCQNPLCSNQFLKHPREISSTGNYFCSRSCAATINNSKYPKRIASIKTCFICTQDFSGREKYCSIECKHKSQIISKEKIKKLIRKFHEKEGRIPLKREFTYHSAARQRFGTWNNAIRAAGFKPNPVLFSKKFKAEDGHMCDSFSEMIVDNWLFEKKIPHERNVYYPNSNLKTDFLIDDSYVEFIGLNGVVKKYDELLKRKRRLVKRLNLNLLEIYPKDLFPENKLDSVFSPILQQW